MKIAADGSNGTAVVCRLPDGQFAIAAANPERGIQISDYADLFYKFGRFTDEIDPVFDAKARKVLIAELKEKALILNPKYGTARHKTRCY